MEQLPHGSATARAIHGESADWGPAEMILANIFDALAVGNWQRGGNKDATRPKPYPRPVSKQATAALGRRLKRLKQKGGEDG